MRSPPYCPPSCWPRVTLHDPRHYGGSSKAFSRSIVGLRCGDCTLRGNHDAMADFSVVRRRPPVELTLALVTLAVLRHQRPPPSEGRVEGDHSMAYELGSRARAGGLVFVPTSLRPVVVALSPGDLLRPSTPSDSDALIQSRPRSGAIRYVAGAHPPQPGPALRSERDVALRRGAASRTSRHVGRDRVFEGGILQVSSAHLDRRAWPVRTEPPIQGRSRLLRPSNAFGQLSATAGFGRGPRL